LGDAITIVSPFGYYVQVTRGLQAGELAITLGQGRAGRVGFEMA
jgi:hypothetical protein